VSITLQGVRTAETPQKIIPANLPNTLLSMAGPMIAEAPPVVRRSGGSGVALGITQDKFVNLVKSKELKQLLTDLPLEDWQIKSFDRKTRKVELRVQNRYITVGV
jgi:hypothetical protein